MIRTKLSFIPAMIAAALLAACTPSLTGAPPGGSMDTPQPTVTQAIDQLATTAADVADALGQAPPATLSRTSIDERAVRVAFISFDAALDIINGLIDLGVIVPGSPRALAVAQGIDTVQAFLNAASAAQRAGNATTYRGALDNARRAIAQLSGAVRGTP